ncbi:hypothetical protein HDV05_007303 [Chytridiales sp. JEL 0842]|nr:hypothetical protein HDV05_007303 [Chytridiales sp. JEL 0842]
MHILLPLLLLTTTLTTLLHAAPTSTLARVDSLLANPPGYASLNEIQRQCTESTTTKWLAHVCAQPLERLQSPCLPQKLLPPSGTPLKGLVVLLHGYTACPDAMLPFAAHLNNLGYAVYLPLNPGHGLKCAEGDTTCVGGSNVVNLPTSKEPYIDFAKFVVEMMQEEKALLSASAGTNNQNLKVHVSGVSLGGAMTTLVSSMAPPGFFDSAVPVNPFYGISFADLDTRINICKSAPQTFAATNADKCINDFVASLVNLDKSANTTLETDPWNKNTGYASLIKTFEAQALQVGEFAIEKTLSAIFRNQYANFWSWLNNRLVDSIENDLLRSTLPRTFYESPMGWGIGCTNNPRRGGYCSFQSRHLLAVNAFAIYASAQTTLTSPTTTTPTGYITTLNDGSISNGFIFATSTHLGNPNESRVSQCFFTLDASCVVSPKLQLEQKPVCGMPHSCFSRAESLLDSPFELYWEENLFGTISGFMEGGGSSGIGQEGGEGDKTVCTRVSLRDRDGLEAKGWVRGGQRLVESNLRRW